MAADAIGSVVTRMTLFLPELVGKQETIVRKTLLCIAIVFVFLVVQFFVNVYFDRKEHSDYDD